MTREEALDYAKSELDAAYKRAEKIGHKGKTRYIEVLEMAIEALSQEPCIYDLKNRYCPRLNEYGMLTYPQEPTVTSTDKPMTMVYPTIVCDDAISREAVDDIFCLYSDKNGMIDAREAVRMVLELPSVNPQPCDDAISREWLMRKATERFYTTNYFNHISAMIEEAPSVTQKSGKWLLNKEKSHFFDVYECSNCAKISGLTNYCPNCGAKMESEEEK